MSHNPSAAGRGGKNTVLPYRDVVRVAKSVTCFEQAKHPAIAVIKTDCLQLEHFIRILMPAHLLPLFIELKWDTL